MKVHKWLTLVSKITTLKCPIYSIMRNLKNNFNIEPHLIKYRKFLRESLGKCVNNIKMLNLNPTYTIADCYGTIKLHREHHPLRPITTGYLSFTNSTEEYLKDIISPLIRNANTYRV